MWSSPAKICVKNARKDRIAWRPSALKASTWASRDVIISGQICISIPVKQRGRERKGPPEIIQKFRLRKWPISSADFPMIPMERAEHHIGPFWEKDFGAISGSPFLSRPLLFTPDCSSKLQRVFTSGDGCWLPMKSQWKTKGQQLKGTIVSEFSHIVALFSHFFRIFPPGLSPSKQRGFWLNENKREEKIIKRTGQIEVAR